jgi:UDP-2,4-diacetamido-2,4,6-trideoxy-beta-L-altropyranose hydrolase
MTTPRALLRADASTSIGTGHIVRCLTLAEALIREGWSVTLASRDLPDGLARLAAAGGVGILEIPTSASIDDEIGRIVSQHGPIGLLVADHYGIGASWFDGLAGRFAMSMAIDDLADRKQPVDVVLNQNLGTTSAIYRHLVPAGATVLCGPRFALVREAFRSRRARMAARSGVIDRVLVFLSGSDANDVTSRAVRALAGLELYIDVVVGAAYGHLETLRAEAASTPGVTVHVNIDRMDALMATADLAIGAPGSASWERCTLGLPSLLVTLADNQRAIERALVEAGAADSVGWHADVRPEMIRAAVQRLRADPPRVRAMSDAAANVTDGRGTIRVVEEIQRRWKGGVAIA